jgi:hypothetical protein
MTDAQRKLHQALKAHKFDLEIERDAASDCDLEERIEATRRVLKWLEQALEPQPELLGEVNDMVRNPSSKSRHQAVPAKERPGRGTKAKVWATLSLRPGEDPRAVQRRWQHRIAE